MEHDDLWPTTYLVGLWDSLVSFVKAVVRILGM
jgi:hypothetical protein